MVLGNGQTTDQAFALELVQTENCQIENVLNYIGVCLLLQFQGNLKGLIMGEDKAKQEGQEPNGVPVKSCASSPGDYLSRICLKSNNLLKTQAFYKDLLGMKVAAADELQLCLRYSSDSGGNYNNYGVPTTPVFEGTNEKLDHGTCSDNLAIRTTTSIHQLYEQWQNCDDAVIYLKPTEMFGSVVMGLRDHNGYKVVLAGPA